MRSAGPGRGEPRAEGNDHQRPDCRHAIESGMLTDAGDRFTAAGPLTPLAIPASLQASLLARLDRLAPVREVAQIGAALGRQFSHELIGAVAPMPQQQLYDALAQLVSAELNLPPRYPAGRRVYLQARIGSGRGLQHFAPQPAPAAPCPYRRHPRRPVPGDRDGPTGAPRPPLQPSRVDGKSGRRIGSSPGGRPGRVRRLSKPSRCSASGWRRFPPCPAAIDAENANSICRSRSVRR